MVSGTVTDNNEPLPGVNILLKGTSNGTITTPEGTYEIQIPESTENPVLIFSYIGYQPLEIPVNNRSTIDVSMQASVEELKEIVVVGYGNQERRDITYAVASVDAKSLEEIPVSGVDQAMQGQIAGVNVTQASGAPGGGVSVQIRGIQTITAGSEPLYVIDGFPFYNSGGGTGFNPLNTINPADIASIDILKDAAATSIYGSRGANGVVIITTKSGSKEQSVIQFSMYEGVQALASPIEMMGRDEFLTFQEEARNNYYEALGYDSNDGVVARYLNVGNNAMLIEDTLYQSYPGFGGETNWYDEIFRTAPIRNYQLSANGGSEKVNYLISGGYYSQDGIIKGTDFERYSFRANINADLNDFIRAGISLAPTVSSRNNQNTEGNFANGGLINAAMVLAPIFPVYERDGETFFSPRVPGRDRFYTNMVVDGRTINPLRPALPGAENPLRLLNNRLNENEIFRSIGSLYVEIDLLENLTFKSTLGADYFTNYGRTFDSNLYPTIEGWPLGSASSFASKTFNWINENTLTYQLNIEETHRLNLTANYSIQRETFENMGVSANNYLDESNTYVNTNFASLNTGNADITYWALESYLARVQYVFNDKYLFTASARVDGSSRFGPGNRYGFFPSGSFGWRFSEEPFIESLNLFDEGKFRLSYGVVGNFNIGNFNWIGLFDGVNYTLGAGAGNPVGGNIQETMGNTDLSWEKSNQFNVGLDLQFFKSRLSVIADYYIINTDGLLLQSKLPFVTGFLDVLRNVGVVRNQGLEFTFTSRNLVNEFKWNTNFNISFNTNEVKQLATEGERLFTGGYHVTEVGKPIGNFFLIESDGVYLDSADVENYEVTSQGLTPYPGARKYLDFDGNGEIDDADRQVVGNPYPDFIFGLTNTFSWKGFDLRVQIYGNVGNEVLNLGRAMSESASGFHNNTMRYWNNRYRSPEQPGDGDSPLPMATTRIWNNQIRASYLVEDASFLRIRNITFGYVLPQNLSNTLLMKRARIYTSIQNAFTLTGYTGFDPEVSSGGTNATIRGLDFGGYPLPRTITVGVDVTF